MLKEAEVIKSDLAQLRHSTNTTSESVKRNKESVRDLVAEVVAMGTLLNATSDGAWVIKTEVSDLKTRMNISEVLLNKTLTAGAATREDVKGVVAAVTTMEERVNSGEDAARHVKSRVSNLQERVKKNAADIAVNARELTSMKSNVEGNFVY